MQEYRKCILDVLQGAISIDHVYNPLLKMSATSSPRNQNNKFRGKCSVSDHLWSSHLTKMTKAKVWVYIFLDLTNKTIPDMFSTILQNAPFHGKKNNVLLCYVHLPCLCCIWDPCRNRIAQRHTIRIFWTLDGGGQLLMLDLFCRWAVKLKKNKKKTL